MKSLRRPLFTALLLLLLVSACASEPSEEQQASSPPLDTDIPASPTVAEATLINTAPASTEAAVEVEAGSILIALSDHKPMVFIPAGSFLMGAADSDANADDDEKPQHSVDIDAFWMDQFEVSNAEYFNCVESGDCRAPAEIDSAGFAYAIASGSANAPVVNVSWDDAGDYCAWADKRLPTEAEWEKAARGEDERVYPWGTDPDAQNKAWFCNECIFSRENPEVLDDFSGPVPVGSFSDGQSPYGIEDLAGNVWEWVQDWYAGETYAELNQVNPEGPAEGDFRVVRGGSWTSPSTYLRSSYRQARGQASNWIDVGFRCVMADDRDALVPIAQITPFPTIEVPTSIPSSGDESDNNGNQNNAVGGAMIGACQGLEEGDACSFNLGSRQLDGVCAFIDNGSNPDVFACDTQ